MSDTMWIKLATVAGLDGIIPCYRHQGQWLALDRDYALRVPSDQTPLTANLRSSEPAHLRLDLNAYEGVAVREIASCDGRPRFFRGGNRFDFQVGAGEFSLTFDRTGSAATGFTARLCRADGNPAVCLEAQAPAPSPQAASPASRYSPAQLSPWHYYNERMNQPGELEFSSTDGWQAWQVALRRKLAELAAEPAHGPVEAEVQAAPFDEPGMKRYLLFLRSEPESIVVCNMLVPDKPNGAALLCLHGHGYAHGETLGLSGGDRQQEQLIERSNYSYALQAARRGYVAITPELRGWGERFDPPRPPKDSCDANFFRAMHLGLTVVGLQLCDLRAVLGCLQTRPDVDPERIGCLGLSYGGRLTMYLSALDDRVKVAVPSGCLNTFRERLAIGSSCGAQFLPGLLQWCDTPDIFGLIAPRPMLLEHGAADGTSPEMYAMAAYDKIERIYEAAGAADRLALDVFPGGHRWNGQAAWDWLERWL